ncbi:diguanylate cyclase [Viridibacillus sp. YIM B01967]|uniref:Diguanylate cyclase n=1 Tax=Viridibacillus soli TaxID=2798301 RepID=A0ABS1HBT3_9BACL|nr:GGDEF domain-containing protein [Viridibacillus soli]MBK3496873.1 diguanylate cyclase [Viridibacillus soli]
MLQSILSNLAIILLLHLVVHRIMNYRKSLRNYYFFLLIVLTFSVAVITMFYLPIEFDGYRVDLRMIPLVFLAYFSNWKLTLPVLVISSIWYSFEGGIGTTPGIIFGMIGPTLLTLAVYKKNKYDSCYFDKILLITICWFISDFPIVFIVPNGLDIFQRIFIWRYAALIGAASVWYALVLFEIKREHLKNQLEFVAWHDSLTKLLNRNKFFEVVEVKREKSDVNHYLAMADLDHFKKLNDTYGHVAGDHILIEISDIFRKYECDLVKVGRYGGEEFIIYQGQPSFEQAVLYLEAIQKEIRTTLFCIDQDIATHVTISIGVAKLENDMSLLEAVKQADRNLYMAKENGRDQIKTSADQIKSTLTTVGGE